MTRPRAIVEVHFVCPFCGLAAIAFVTDAFGVAHCLPECDRFKQLDPYQFLKQANKLLAKTGAPLPFS